MISQSVTLVGQFISQLVNNSLLALDNFSFDESVIWKISTFDGPLVISHLVSLSFSHLVTLSYGSFVNIWIFLLIRLSANLFITHLVSLFDTWLVAETCSRYTILLLANHTVGKSFSFPFSQ